MIALVKLRQISNSKKQQSSLVNQPMHKGIDSQQTTEHFSAFSQKSGPIRDCQQSRLKRSFSMKAGRLLSEQARNEKDCCTAQEQKQKAKIKGFASIFRKESDVEKKSTSSIKAGHDAGSFDDFCANLVQENPQTIALRRDGNSFPQEASCHKSSAVAMLPALDTKLDFWQQLIQKIQKDSAWTEQVQAEFSKSRNLFNTELFNKIKTKILNTQNFSELIQQLKSDCCNFLNPGSSSKNESIDHFLEYMDYCSHFLEVLVDEILKNAPAHKITPELKFFLMQAHRLVCFFRFLKSCTTNLFANSMFIDNVYLTFCSVIDCSKEEYTGEFYSLDFLLHQQEYANAEYINRIFAKCFTVTLVTVFVSEKQAYKEGLLTDCLLTDFLHQTQEILTALEPLLIIEPSTQKIRDACKKTRAIINVMCNALENNRSHNTPKSCIKNAQKIKKLWEEQFIQKLSLAKAKDLKKIFMDNASRCFDLCFQLVTKLKISAITEPEYFPVQLSECEQLKNSLTELNKSFQWVPDKEILEREFLFVHKKSFWQKLKTIFWYMFYKISDVFNGKNDWAKKNFITTEHFYSKNIEHMHSQLMTITNTVIRIQGQKQSYLHTWHDKVSDKQEEYPVVPSVSFLSSEYRSLAETYQSSSPEEMGAGSDNENRCSRRFSLVPPSPQDKRVSAANLLIDTNKLNNKDINKIFIKVRSMDSGQLEKFVESNFVCEKIDWWVSIDPTDQRILLEKIYDSHPQLFIKNILRKMHDVFERKHPKTHLLWTILLNKGSVEFISLILSKNPIYAAIVANDEGLGCISGTLLGRIMKRGLWPLAYQLLDEPLFLRFFFGPKENMREKVNKYGQTLLNQEGLDFKDLPDYETHLKVFLLRFNSSKNIQSMDIQNVGNQRKLVRFNSSLDIRNVGDQETDMEKQKLDAAIKKNNIKSIKNYFKKNSSLRFIVKGDTLSLINQSRDVVSILKAFYSMNPFINLYFVQDGFSITLIQYFIKKGNLAAVEYLYSLNLYSRSHKNSLLDFLRDGRKMPIPFNDIYIKKDEEYYSNLEKVESFLYAQVEKPFNIMKADLPGSLDVFRQRCLGYSDE